MLELDESGYEIVMHVHDEIVLRVEKVISIDDINKIMEKDIGYLPNLKLKADTNELRLCLDNIHYTQT